MKVLAIIGVRPNFIKHYAFQKACRRNEIDLVTVYTGQHAGETMADVFFRDLDLEPPDYVYSFIRQTPANDLAGMMVFIESVIMRERPQVTLVYGDVTSTMAGALASTKLGVPVTHVEAGVHTACRNNPEEVNRRVAEFAADTLFAHTREAYDELLAAGFNEADVVLTGDIVKDSLDLVMADRGIEVSDENYIAVTLHRAENTDDPSRLAAICGTLIDSDRDFRFPVHPRTRAALERDDLWRSLDNCSHIELMPPLSYPDSIRLVAACERVASDSGGLRREAYVLGKPVISLTEMVWVPEMVAAGWEWVAGADREKIRYGLDRFTPPTERPRLFGDGRAADRIARTLLERYGGEASSSERIDGGSAPTPTGARTRVSLVIPCFNEANSLPTLFRRLDQLRQIIDSERWVLEYVLVDDGSSDGTGELLRANFAQDRLTRLVCNERNLGLGGALKAGVSAASGDIVVTVDADTNYDLRNTPELLQRLDPDTDVVSASPLMPGGAWNYPVHRFLLSRCAATLYKLVLGGKGKDIAVFTCGFRAYRRDILGGIMPRADGFLATAEMLMRALLAGHTVAEIPVTQYARKHGRSKMHYLPTVSSHLAFMWKVLRRRVDAR